MRFADQGLSFWVLNYTLDGAPCRLAADFLGEFLHTAAFLSFLKPTALPLFLVAILSTTSGMSLNTKTESHSKYVLGGSPTKMLGKVLHCGVHVTAGVVHGSHIATDLQQLSQPSLTTNPNQPLTCVRFTLPK